MLSPAMPILMYHQVTPRPMPAFRKYAVTPRMFAAQMHWLALNGYVSITLDRLLAHRSGRGALPKRPVIITFDDGFQDCLEHAVPILQTHGFTAIFYLVAGLMGKTSEWLIAERGVSFPLMDWTAARQLAAAGFQCGAHTLSHPRLADLGATACQVELCESRWLLEDRLGQEVRHLAYPFGSYDEQVRTLAIEAGYRSACSVRIGLSTPDDDLLALHRVPVIGQDSLLDFVCRLRTARIFTEALRGRARDLCRIRATGVQVI
jgi:peptidoglycan/xylan/chitin deacetylase (PgdA/CDA1 family)